MGHLINSKKGIVRQIIIVIIVLAIIYGIFWFKTTETYQVIKEKPFFKYGETLLGYSPGLKAKSFFIGLLAGFWVWLGFLITRATHTERTFGDELLKEEGDKIRDDPKRWLAFIAGRIWKVPLIALIYWLLLQLPIINRIVQIVTLEFLGFGFWSLSFIIALEIGYLPVIAQKIWELRQESKYEKKVIQAARGAAMTSEMGRK